MGLAPQLLQLDLVPSLDFLRNEKDSLLVNEGDELTLDRSVSDKDDSLPKLFFLLLLRGLVSLAPKLLDLSLPYLGFGTWR